MKLRDRTQAEVQLLLLMLDLTQAEPPAPSLYFFGPDSRFAAKLSPRSWDEGSDPVPARGRGKCTKAGLRGTPEHEMF